MKETIVDLNDQIKLLEEFAVFKKEHEQDKPNDITFVKINPLTKKGSIHEIIKKEDVKTDEIPLEKLYK